MAHEHRAGDEVGGPGDDERGDGTSRRPRPVVQTVPGPRTAVDDEDSQYIERQASELAYHARVLATAMDPRNPLLDRLRFCSFFATLTDEFVRVRVAGLKEQQAAGLDARSRAGRRPQEQVVALQDQLQYLAGRCDQLWSDDLRPALQDAGIDVLGVDDVTDDDRVALQSVFDERIFPVLTPLAVGPAHPFPFISDLSLSLAVSLDASDGGPGFARVKVPSLLDRFVDVPRADDRKVLVWVEDVIGANLDRLFPGRDILDWHPFRVTRNADYEVEDVDVEDLLEAVADEIKDRRFGRAVRLEITDAMPDDVLAYLSDELDLHDDEVVRVSARLDVGDLAELADLDRPDLTRPSVAAVDVPALSHDDVFGTLRDGDVLVHHPYESFTTSTLHFIERAAVDPRVLAIKQTLYRTSGDSPVVEAMTRAAHAGKQVVVLVELKARFDEAANIEWSRELEEAGVHVVYGFVAAKTHTKVCLVVREDDDGVIRRYGHVATGNYNPRTARVYEDLGLFTAAEDVTADLGDLFNMLTGKGEQLRPRSMLVAPNNLRSRLVELIDEQAHDEGRIVIKVNNLSHVEVIEALYEAAQRGADIDLVVRTVCCLRPGVPGLSEGIRVRSLVGPVLEHSRVYRFGHDPAPGAYLLGSADLMDRNLDDRVEAVVPVEDPDLRRRLDEVLEEVLADERFSWSLDGDGLWTPAPGDRDAQARLERAARDRRAS